MADTVSRTHLPLRPAPYTVRSIGKDAANVSLLCVGVYSTSKEVGRFFRRRYNSGWQWRRDRSQRPFQSEHSGEPHPW